MSILEYFNSCVVNNTFRWTRNLSSKRIAFEMVNQTCTGCVHKMKLFFSSVLCILQIAIASSQDPTLDLNPGHLFSSGSSALSWDSDELARIRFLHIRSFNDRKHFLASRDLASYLGLNRVNGLHLPVPVNIILIGFQNDGNREISLKSEDLQVSVRLMSS